MAYKEDVDATLIDHGLLAGLGDDDHTIYSLVDGTRAFTGDVTMEQDLFIGTTAGGITVGGVSALTREVIHNTSAGSGSEIEIGVVRHDNVGASYGSLIVGARARGTAVTPLTVVSGDMLTSIVALGHDGTDYGIASRIDFLVDAVPGAGDMPGRIVFGTSPDGTEVPVEALRISSDQKSSFSGNANPISNDAAALGEVGTAWSDLALASGAVIDFNNDIQYTHSSNAITMTGGAFYQNATSLATGTFYHARYSANSFASNRIFRKSRHGTIGSHTILVDNDSIGLDRYYGSDGSAFIEGAQIAVRVDGTPGAGDMPMDIAFVTRPAAGALATRMTIGSDGNILIASDNQLLLRDTAIGMYSQANTFMDFFADGGMRFGDSSAGAPTNYSMFEPDGTLVFAGTATVFKDTNIGAATLSGPGGLQPGIVNYIDEAAGDTGIATYGVAVGEGFSGQFEMQHDYKEGSDITFHVHWQGTAAPTGTDKVQWQLTYTVLKEDQTLDAVTVITVETDFDTQYEQKISNFAAITGTAFNIEDQFIFTLQRIAASADEYGGEALTATVGIHYEVDTVGSRTISAK